MSLEANNPLLIEKKSTERNIEDGKPDSENGYLTSVLSCLSGCCYSIFCEPVPEEAKMAVNTWKQFP